jgi:hypothetical protein
MCVRVLALYTYACKHTYIPLTLYPKGVAEVSQIFLRDTHVLPKLLSYTADVTGGKSPSPAIPSVSAINPLVAFYDIHGGKREVLFFYFVRTPHET